MPTAWTIGVERRTFSTVEVFAASRDDAERRALVACENGAGDFDLQHDEYVVIELVDVIEHPEQGE